MKKVEAVRHFPKPKDARNVGHFLGLVGFYDGFIKIFGKMAKPLTRLLQNFYKFVWNDLAQQAFEGQKETLCMALIIQYPNFTRPWLITTGASGHAIGAVVSQGEIGHYKTIAYIPRVLKIEEALLKVHEKEALTMVHGVTTFRPNIFLGKSRGRTMLINPIGIPNGIRMKPITQRACCPPNRK